MKRLHRDERGFVGGSFVRLFVIVIVLGIAAVETSSIIFARVQAQDAAESAALAAADSFRDTGDLDLARGAAEVDVTDKYPDARLATVELVGDEQVKVVVTKRASTLLVHRFGFSKGLATARGEHTAAPPPV